MNTGTMAIYSAKSTEATHRQNSATVARDRVHSMHPISTDWAPLGSATDGVAARSFTHSFCGPHVFSASGLVSEEAWPGKGAFVYTSRRQRRDFK